MSIIVFIYYYVYLNLFYCYGFSEYFYQTSTNTDSFLETNIVKLPNARIRRFVEPINSTTPSQRSTFTQSTIEKNNITKAFQKGLKKFQHLVVILNLYKIKKLTIHFH